MKSARHLTALLRHGPRPDIGTTDLVTLKNVAIKTMQKNIGKNKSLVQRR